MDILLKRYFYPCLLFECKLVVLDLNTACDNIWKFLDVTIVVK